MPEWKYQSDPRYEQLATGAIGRDSGVTPDRMGALMDEIEAEAPRNPLYKSKSPVGKGLDVAAKYLADGDIEKAKESIETLLKEKGPPPQNEERIKEFRTKRVDEILTEMQLSYKPATQAKLLAVLDTAKVGIEDGKPRTELKSVVEFATADPALKSILDSVRQDTRAFMGSYLGQASPGSIEQLKEQLKDKTLTPEQFIVSLLENRNGLPEALRAYDQGKADADRYVNVVAKIHKDNGGSDELVSLMQDAIGKASQRETLDDAALLAAQLVVATSDFKPGQKVFDFFDKVPKSDKLMMRILASMEQPAKANDLIQQGDDKGKLANAQVLKFYTNPNINGRTEDVDVVKAIYCLTAIKDPYDKLEALVAIKRVSKIKVGDPEETIQQKLENGLAALPGRQSLDKILKDTLNAGICKGKPGNAEMLEKAFHSENTKEFAALTVAMAVAYMKGSGTGALNKDQLRGVLGAANIVGKVELERTQKIASDALKNHDPKTAIKDCEARGDMTAVLVNRKQFRTYLKIALGMTSDAFDKIYPN